MTCLKRNKRHLQTSRSDLQTDFRLIPIQMQASKLFGFREAKSQLPFTNPKATIKAQEINFKGSLSNFGHGLQRSFLLAILQELALIEIEPEEGDSPDQSSSHHDRPTLIFACEEPELYQHPPQARHLNNVLRDLSKSESQVLLTTHSPYFVSGEAFEEIRSVSQGYKFWNVLCTTHTF